MVKIRRVKDTDFEAIWDIFHQVVKKGDTFAFDPESNEADFKNLWMSSHVRTFVAELNGKVRGTYILRQNQAWSWWTSSKCGLYGTS